MKNDWKIRMNLEATYYDHSKVVAPKKHNAFFSKSCAIFSIHVAHVLVCNSLAKK